MKLLETLIRLLKHLIISFIKLYKYFISPLLLPSCRFQPTCSEYAVQVIEKHGLLIGVFYSLKRLLRCNPMFKSGWDPVPERRGKHKCQTCKD
jgi:putative membrane protein insertion efficiency factor